MSLRLQKQIDQLRKDRDIDRAIINNLKTQNEWIIKEMKTGLRDVIERVVKQTIEIDVIEKSTDEKIKELM